MKIMHSFSEIKQSFHSRLSPKFSESEINHILKEMSIKYLDNSILSVKKSHPIELSSVQYDGFIAAIDRLLNDEPFQHIIGMTYFYNLELLSDERALIPRPETEELVDWIVKDFSSVVGGNVLDLCSGTGCIALSLSLALNNPNVIALEYSDRAISLINENINYTKESVEVVKMDALSKVSYDVFPDNSFDCWVSNPPYIPEKDKSFMHANVLEHEPGMALFVKDSDPLMFYSVIAEMAIKKLKQGGALFFEIHEGFGQEVVSLLEEVGFVNIVLRKDLQGKDRMIKAIK